MSVPGTGGVEKTRVTEADDLPARIQRAIAEPWLTVPRGEGWSLEYWQAVAVKLALVALQSRLDLRNPPAADQALREDREMIARRILNCVDPAQNSFDVRMACVAVVRDPDSVLPGRQT